MLSDKDKEKIPVKWYQLIEIKRDKDYKFDARNEDVVLLPDTEKILSVIYTDYLATEYERKVIKAKENRFIHKKNNTEIKNKEVELKGETSKSMIGYKNDLWNKMVNGIKNIFKLR